jgi:hypothetical protein
VNAGKARTQLKCWLSIEVGANNFEIEVKNIEIEAKSIETPFALVCARAPF